MSVFPILLDDPPRGSERGYNGLRPAGSPAAGAGDKVRVFLMGDAVAGAKLRQAAAKDEYGLEVMLAGPARGSGEVGARGSFPDARGTSMPRGHSRRTVVVCIRWAPRR